MKTITQALLAFGFVGAMAIGTPITAKAQGVYIAAPGIGVEIGNRPYRYRNSYRYYRDSDNYYGSNYYGYNQRSYYQPNYYNSYGYSGYSRGYSVPSDIR